MLARRERGVSIIEIMIGLAILAFLMMAGLPAFQSFIANSRIRATAEGFYTGLQGARAEAVKRNAQVQFVLTTDDPIDAYKNTTNLSSSALNFLVRTPDPAIPGNYLFVMGKPAAEGAGGTPTVQLATVDDTSTTVASITFTPFGATTLTSKTTLAFSNPVGGACAPTGPMRCLNVVVSIGGQIKMCDPAVTSATDTRKC